MTAPANSVDASTVKRTFWITEASLANAKERVTNLPHKDNVEELANFLDKLVVECLAQPGCVEELRDGTEEARLVRIMDADANNENIYALVKKSIKPENGAFAVVTVMTQGGVDRKRGSGSWKQPSVNSLAAGKNGAKLLALAATTQIFPTSPKLPAVIKMVPPTPERKTIPQMKTGTYLILYNVPNSAEKQQAWADPDAIQEVLDSINSIQGVYGLEAYKKVSLGLRIMDSK